MNSHIIHIDLQPTLSDVVGEDMVHECLKGGRGIGETKEHDCRFKESKRVDESGFPLVFLSKADIVISPSYIKLGEQV